MTRSGQAGRPGRGRANKIPGTFVPHTYDMLKSPAWQALSAVSLRILSRLEQEHLSHGRTMNGDLQCTYDDFQKCGVGRAAIAKALRELEALGFIEIRRGYSGLANACESNRYRLCYLPANNDRATNEWQNISTLEDARALAKKARETLSTRHYRPSYNQKRLKAA
jgi:hypothetical protein